MSKVQVIFPISDFSITHEMDMYAEVTEEEILKAVRKAVNKLYVDSFKVINEGYPLKREVILEPKCDQYETLDADGVNHRCQVFDLILKGNKINYFFLRIYQEV